MRKIFHIQSSVLTSNSEGNQKTNKIPKKLNNKICKMRYSKIFISRFELAGNLNLSEDF